MKKIFFSLLFAAFLSSCGTSERAIPGISTTEFTGSGFSIHIPEKWSSTGSTDININIGTPVLSAISPEKKYNFSPNIVIILDDLKFLGTSKQYSEQNIIKTRKSYLEYKTKKQGDIIFNDSDASKYFVFDAKYNNQTVKIRFIQTAKVCGTHVYLLHGSMPLDSDPDIFVKIFKTFHCK